MAEAPPNPVRHRHRSTDRPIGLQALAPRIRRLPCGLTLLLLPHPTLHRVVIDTHVRVGSRFETPANNGLSHFLEHMMYRGCPSEPSAQQLALAFESMGGTLMAATGTDSGALTISSPPENFARLFSLYAEVFQSPVLDGIETERDIVSEEIRESLDERGNPVDPDNLIRALAFRGHALGLPITGTLAQLRRFDRTMLRSHHRRHYTGRNTVMAIAGPIEPKVVVEQVESQFASLPKGKALRCTAPAKPVGPRFSYVRDRGSQTTLRVAFRAPGIHSTDEPAVDALLRIIDDGMSTRLYRSVCDDNGLCYDVSASYEAYVDSGLFEFRAETGHDRALTVLTEIFRITRDLREAGPSAQELLKVKQRHLWQLREMLDSPEALTSYYALGQLAHVLRTPEERQRELGKLDPHALKAAATRLFRPAHLSVLAVGILSRHEQAALRERVSHFV